MEWSCFNSDISSQQLKIQVDCINNRTGYDHVQVFAVIASGMTSSDFTCFLESYRQRNLQPEIMDVQAKR